MVCEGERQDEAEFQHHGWIGIGESLATNQSERESEWVITLWK